MIWLRGQHQILASRFAFDSARQVLKGEDIAGIGPLSWLNHGTYSLKGVDEPIEICEVGGEEGEAVLAAPGDSEKVHRHVAPGDEPVLGWRPATDRRFRTRNGSSKEISGKAGSARSGLVATRLSRNGGCLNSASTPTVFAP